MMTIKNKLGAFARNVYPITPWLVFVTNREWLIEVITLISDHNSRDSDDSDADLLDSTYHRPQLTITR